MPGENGIVKLGCGRRNTGTTLPVIHTRHGKTNSKFYSLFLETMKITDNITDLYSAMLLLEQLEDQDYLEAN